MSNYLFYSYACLTPISDFGNAGSIFEQEITSQRGMELQNKQEDDRISLLPDHIIHEFLSLLDTKAVARSCVLSKTWQRAWASFPRIDFNQYYFNARECEHPKYSPTKNIEIRMKKDAFLSYIDNSLQSRLELEHVEKFTLIFSHHDKDLVLPRVIKWLTFAIERNVKVLILNLGVRDFIIPQVLLEAKTISELRLTNAKLESNNKFKFSHLKKLGLNHVHLDEKVIQNLTLTCPLIEDFQLHSCHGLKQLKLSNLSRIKLLDLCIGIEVSRIEIEAPSLQTFCYRWDMCGYPLENNRYCDICLEGCKKLKTLNLVSHHEMPIELLQNLSSKFPTLEVLHISNCKMPSIKFSCQTLKEFTLNSCHDLEVVEVNTPNLVSLCCKRNKLPFYSFNTPSLQKLELDFDLGFPTLFPPWFDKLKEFVGKFNNSEGLNMVIHSNVSILSFLLNFIGYYKYNNYMLNFVAFLFSF